MRRHHHHRHRHLQAGLSIGAIVIGVSSLPACGTLLGLGSSDDDEPPPSSSGDAQADVTGPSQQDSASLIDTSSPSPFDGSSPLPGSCNITSDCAVAGSGQEVTCWSQRCIVKMSDKSPLPVVGVLVTNTDLYFSVPGVSLGTGQLLSTPLASMALVVRLSGEYRLGALAFGNTSNEIFFAKGQPGTDGLSGVFRCQLDGKGRLPVTVTDLPDTRSFAHPKNTNIVYTATEGQPFIKRVQGPEVKTFVASTTGTVQMMALSADESTLVYGSGNGVHAVTLNVPDGGSPADVLIGNDVAGAIGIAVQGSFVYFTNMSGAVKRVPVTGGAVEKLFDGPSSFSPTTVGDIDISPSGDAAYFAINGAVYRLALK